ncbi:cytochrome c4 [Aquincola tertiaricarbonis]|uniref:Cytochrome c4 n=1 Tax=Aquincola tertiaricarbonis TaxID=391953 RepID=A0ABY4S7N1_AQUTE|nr:c-type cytochrome [Aquincola tertiaricarbonis]URI08027.1 cytochrome c4 [Aquincola tertiaricarbonis]
MNKAHSLLFVLALSGIVSGASAQDIKPDAAAGAKKVAMCIGCHGIPEYKAAFPEQHLVPKISGQGAKYIVAALNSYKTGDRKHPTMRGIATSLTDQDMADIAAFYEGNVADPKPVSEEPAVKPRPEVAELLTKGACVSCHGANFSKPIDGSYPKIAGQYPDYLYVALKSYKTTNNNLIGRGNAIMAGQVKQYSNVELKAIAEYIGSLPGELQTRPESRFRFASNK